MVSSERTGDEIPPSGHFRPVATEQVADENAVTSLYELHILIERILQRFQQVLGCHLFFQ